MIQRAVTRLDAPTQAEVAARVHAAGVPLSQPDVSAILNGNVKAFAPERLMQVAATLGMTVTVSNEASKGGGRPRPGATPPAPPPGRTVRDSSRGCSLTLKRPARTRSYANADGGTMPQQQDRERSGQRRAGKDPHRTAAFREAARAIVFKDRGDRRAGLNVDTAGAIAQALERAYAQGFADAQAPTPPPEAAPGADAAGAIGPVEWFLIPPRPRNAFWTICLFVLGRDPAAMLDGTGHLYPTMTPSGRPGWQLVTRTGRED